MPFTITDTGISDFDVPCYLSFMRLKLDLHQHLSPHTSREPPRHAVFDLQVPRKALKTAGVGMQSHRGARTGMNSSCLPPE